MMLLNGVFCWFKNLSEFWQTALVAAGIFMAGLSVGLFFHSYKGLPAQVRSNTQTVEVLENKQDSLTNSQDSIIVTLNRVNNTLDTISEQVSNVYWRVEIISCYQKNDGSTLQSCLEESRNGVPSSSVRPQPPTPDE